MQKSDSNKVLFLRFPLCTLILLLIPLYLIGIGQRDLWAPDEPRFTQIANEMLQTGDWTVPRMNGEDVALLPPMTYWLSTMFSLPYGEVTAFTARLPIALMAFGIIIFFFVMGQRLWGTSLAFSASIILATSAIFIHQAEWIQADMALFCSITLSLMTFHAHYKHKCSSLLPMYIAMGFGTLAKGPVAVIVPCLVILPFLIVEKNWKHLLKMHLPLGICLWAIIVVPWYFLVCQQTDAAFAEEILFKHNFGMFFDTWSHERPFYYYLINFPWEFLPWFLFIPALIMTIIRKQWIKQPEYQFYFIWFIVMFLFFSVSQAKQPKYILPLFPAIAFLTASILHNQQTLGSRLLCYPFLMMPILFAVGIFIPLFSDQIPLPLLASSICALLFLGFSYASYLLFNRKTSFALVAVIATFAIVMPFARYTIIPEINTFKSARTICETFLKHQNHNEPIGLYGIHFRQAGPYIYYSKQHIEIFEDKTDAFISFMESPDHRFAFVDQKDYKKNLDSKAKVSHNVLFTQTIGHRTMLLISNQ